MKRRKVEKKNQSETNDACATFVGKKVEICKLQFDFL